jgi:hypothetical protein
MPKCLLFAPCEKALLNQGDGLLSLINVIEQINLGRSPHGEIPEDLGVPIKWNLVTLWRNDPEETGKVFEQRVEVIAPNGQRTLDATVEFQLTSRGHRTNVEVQGMAVGQPGDHICRLSLREAGKKTRWTKVAEYSLIISHAGPETAQPQP